MKYDIGIDVRMIPNTGIGTYLRGLLGGLPEHYEKRRWKMALFGLPSNSDSKNGIAREKFGAKIYSLQEQMEYAGHLNQCKVWHAPHYNVPYVKGKTKLVVTIHDLIHWIFRHDFFSPLQAFYSGQMMRRAIDRSDHIIAVSEQTKNDIVQYFNGRPEKISVIYEGVDREFFEPVSSEKKKAVSKKYGLLDPYFLYVGMIKPHKNIVRLVRIFEKMFRQKKVTSPLILVGKLDPKYQEAKRLFSNLAPESGVRLIEGVDASEIRAIYQMALALIHPSLYEGFGLTLLEAMASGTPVIANRAASIPEVTGDSALLIDATSDEAISGGLIRMEQDSMLRNQLKEKGLVQARRFQWEDMARKTAAVYEEVLSGVEIKKQ